MQKFYNKWSRKKNCFLLKLTEKYILWGILYPFKTSNWKKFLNYVQKQPDDNA